MERQQGSQPNRIGTTQPMQSFGFSGGPSQSLGSKPTNMGGQTPQMTPPPGVWTTGQEHTRDITPPEVLARLTPEQRANRGLPPLLNDRMPSVIEQPRTISGVSPQPFTAVRGVSPQPVMPTPTPARPSLPAGATPGQLMQNAAGEWGKYSPGGNWHGNVGNRFGPLIQAMMARG